MIYPTRQYEAADKVGKECFRLFKTNFIVYIKYLIGTQLMGQV